MSASLESAMGRALVRWPRLAGKPLDLATFAAHVRARDCEPAESALEELYLACACANGDPDAHAVFETNYLVHVPRYVGSLDSSAAFADDVKQRLRELLFTGDRPKIGEYAGRGPLGGWLRTAAARVALRARKTPQHTVLESSPGRSHADATPDPELALLRKRCRADFSAAMEAAVKSLSLEERTFLRLAAFDQLTVEQIGALAGVHGSTVSRRLAGARARLADEVRRALSARLALRGPDLDSVLRAAQSQLDLSLRGLLAGEA